MTVLYFAFGSNLNERQMKDRCPSARPIERAWLHGERLVFRSYSFGWRGGGASIVPADRRRTAGIVYAMSKEDLRKMDGYEGHPFSYKRERVHVQAMHDASLTYECWTYRLPGGGFNPPSHRYLAQIYVAYVDWGFDLRALPRPSRLSQPLVSARFIPPKRKAVEVPIVTIPKSKKGKARAKRKKAKAAKAAPPQQAIDFETAAMEYAAKAIGNAAENIVRRRRIAAAAAMAAGPTKISKRKAPAKKKAGKKQKRKRRPAPDAPARGKYDGWSTRELADELRRETIRFF
jgi:gamma-glutamylcyclotransferase (GGCT)/AIG2-like uncharacterized protein YtfP